MGRSVEIFFCYAREDELLRKGLEKQLKVLKRQGLIDFWYDRDITAGTEWEREIDKHLNSSDIVLLLISPDFMDSDYCYSIEMKRAMERHERKEARVIPIILRPVYFKGAPFGKLQVLPMDAVPIASGKWHNLDEAFYNVAEGIREAVEEILLKQQPETTSASQTEPDKKQQHKGENIEQPVELTFHEAVMGATRTFNIQSTETCPTCRGTGITRKNPCANCSGEGTLLHNKRIQVNIPAGMHNGSKIRVAGQGQPSMDGGPRGDLFLVINVKPDSTSQTETFDEPKVSKWSTLGSKTIGIDLGTTNSCVALIEDGKPTILPNAEGSRTTPSVVAINKYGEHLVGEMAKHQASIDSENVVFSIMRFMGRKYNEPDISRYQHLAPYKIISASNGDAWIELQGKSYSPPQIAAMILQKFKNDAEIYIGREVTQAVIAVPAYFNDAQRQAVKDAGKIAGLEVLNIINASTAAALAYGFDKENNELIAIYDFGGGTFTFSIVEKIGNGIFEVKGTNGDTYLGGDDFDQRIISWVIEVFLKESGIDLSQNHVALQRLKEAAEKAKKELSSVTQTVINLPSIIEDAKGSKNLYKVLSRSKLEQLVADLVGKSRTPVMQALSDTGIRPQDIHEVILVGGQTRMPAIQTEVQDIFDRKPHRLINPDEVVATGAAIKAGILSGDVKGILLRDITPLSLGIETLGAIFTPMIGRNTPIPVRRSEVFSTASDNQPSVEINVLQGERKLAWENHSIGSFILDGIPSAPRGVPQIEVTFDIDANGIVNVSARDKGTGRAQKIVVEPSTGLIKSQIDRMVHDAEIHSSEDQSRKEVIDEWLLADSAAYRAEKSIIELSEKLTPAQKSELESKISNLRSLLQGNSRTVDIKRAANIKSAREDLEQSFYKISEALYIDRQKVPFE